jgi:hypothetical protein
MSVPQDQKDWMQDPATLTEEIDATREDVGDTLEALQEKLSPSQIFDQSVSYLGDRGYELACSIGRAAREHPVPFAIAAAGAVWYLTRRSRGELDIEVELDDELEAGATFDDEAGLAGEYGTTGYGESATQRAGRKARSAAASVKQRAASVKNRAASAASSVAGTASEATDAVGRTARRAKSEFSRVLEEQPLLVGAIGLAIGAAVAALIPVGEREERLFGDKSEQLVRRAKQKAGETMDRAKDTARRAAEGARAAIAETEQGGGSSGGTAYQPGNGSGTSQPSGQQPGGGPSI